MSTKIVHVAVGVVLKDERIFLTKRADNAHQGGKWEFPGGKVEVGESVYQALHRELNEEIAIDTLSCIPFMEIVHDYGDKTVKLDVFIVNNFQGEPEAQEGQDAAWVLINDLMSLDFPAANLAIVERLIKQYG